VTAGVGDSGDSPPMISVADRSRSSEGWLVIMKMVTPGERSRESGQGGWHHK
jgi:hypothetical protein